MALQPVQGAVKQRPCSSLPPSRWVDLPLCRLHHPSVDQKYIVTPDLATLVISAAAGSSAS
jgi:hypothetical protein